MSIGGDAMNEQIKRKYSIMGIILILCLLVLYAMVYSQPTSKTITTTNEEREALQAQEQACKSYAGQKAQELIQRWQELETNTKSISVSGISIPSECRWQSGTIQRIRESETKIRGIITCLKEQNSFEECLTKAEMIVEDIKREQVLLTSLLNDLEG